MLIAVKVNKINQQSKFYNSISQDLCHKKSQTKKFDFKLFLNYII